MRTFLPKLAWAAVAVLGALALGVMALHRGETINAAWLVIAAVCTYAVGYRFYARFLATLLLPLGLSAQPEQSSAGRNCRGALTSTLASGHEHRDLRPCLARTIPELAEAIEHAGAETRPSRLMLLHRVSMTVRDPAIFGAGMALAKNTGAAPAVRVLGLHVAVSQLDASIGFYSFGVSRPFREPLSQHCEEVVLSHTEVVYQADNGLPGTAEHDLRGFATSLASNSAEPLIVRRFANCIVLVLPEPDSEK